MISFITDDVWQLTNGVLAILGIFLVVVIGIYLSQNVRRVYGEPIRFITLSFALIILGHTVKDGSGYAMRAWNIKPHDWVIFLALVLVGLGKLGCIAIWSDPRWGAAPWLIAVGLVMAFLAFNATWG